MSTGAKAVAEKIVCDGCGLRTTSEHIARRLRRLELATRYRPIHIQAVFLGAQSPAEESAFLYGAGEGFTDEAAALLRALRIEFADRDHESVLNEFQRNGFFLTHVLECVPEGLGTGVAEAELLRKRLPTVIRKIRGSLKPKRVVVIAPELGQVLSELRSAVTTVEWVIDGEKPFDLSDGESVSNRTSALGAL